MKRLSHSLQVANSPLICFSKDQGCCKRVNTRGRAQTFVRRSGFSRLRLCRLLAVFIWGLLQNSYAAGSELEFYQGLAEIEHDIVKISAAANVSLGEEAISALNSGIRLFFNLEIVASRPRRFWWDAELHQGFRRFSLQRHALSDQFVLGDLIDNSFRVFQSLDTAVMELGHLSQLPIAELTDLAGAKQVEIAIRLRLDISALPAPMLPIAYISPAWHISSGWYRWDENF